MGSLRRTIESRICGNTRTNECALSSINANLCGTTTLNCVCNFRESNICHACSSIFGCHITKGPCNRSQHVGPNNVVSCWPTMLRAFARALIGNRTTCLFKLEITGLKKFLGLSSEFFSSNYFQIGQHVVLLHIQIFLSERD